MGRDAREREETKLHRRSNDGVFSFFLFQKGKKRKKQNPVPFPFNGISLLVAIPDLLEAQVSLPRDLGGRRWSEAFGCEVGVYFGEAGSGEGGASAPRGLRGRGKRERKDSTLLSFPCPGFVKRGLASSSLLPLSRSPFRGRAPLRLLSPALFPLVPPAPMLQPTTREIFFAHFFFFKTNETEEKQKNRCGVSFSFFPLFPLSPTPLLFISPPRNDRQL